MRTQATKKEKKKKKTQKHIKHKKDASLLFMLFDIVHEEPTAAATDSIAMLPTLLRATPVFACCAHNRTMVPRKNIHFAGPSFILVFSLSICFMAAMCMTKADRFTLSFSLFLISFNFCLPLSMLLLILATASCLSCFILSISWLFFFFFVHVVFLLFFFFHNFFLSFFFSFSFSLTSRACLIHSIFRLSFLLLFFALVSFIFGVHIYRVTPTEWRCRVHKLLLFRRASLKKKEKICSARVLFPSEKGRKAFVSLARARIQIIFCFFFYNFLLFSVPFWFILSVLAWR